MILHMNMPFNAFRISYFVSFLLMYYSWSVTKTKHRRYCLLFTKTILIPSMINTSCVRLSSKINLHTLTVRLILLKPNKAIHVFIPRYRIYVWFEIILLIWILVMNFNTLGYVRNWTITHSQNIMQIVTSTSHGSSNHNIGPTSH